SGGRAELIPEVRAGAAQPVGNRAIQFGRHWPRTNAGAEALGDANDTLDPARPKAEADQRAAGCWRRTGDKRIVAVIDIEHRPLRALAQDLVAKAQALVQVERRLTQKWL